MFNRRLVSNQRPHLYSTRLRSKGISVRRNSLKPITHQGILNAKGFRFAIVASRWNEFLTSRLVEGALDALEQLAADEKRVELFRVPGSFEIPLCALKAAESGELGAVVCLGVIIRGQTA